MDALVGLHGALLHGRRFVWEQAHRAISLLVLSPQALQPEHLVQVRHQYKCRSRHQTDPVFCVLEYGCGSHVDLKSLRLGRM